MAIHHTGTPADGPGTRLGGVPAATADESRTARPDPAAGREAAPPGLQVSFSAQSLQALEAAALAQAARAGAEVQGFGEALGDGISAAAGVIDAVAVQASDLLMSGVQALTAGLGAVESGVADSTRRLGELASSTVGYGALAALAGGALLDELV
ncbi:MAG: hypothetical protein IV092_24530 [Burkholderiaceae bacterium]|nr:hypothetical protein [Burkholderiaceae bacterium]